MKFTEISTSTKGFKIDITAERQYDDAVREKYVRTPRLERRWNNAVDALYDFDSGIYQGDDGELYTVEFDWSETPALPLVWHRVIEDVVDFDNILKHTPNEIAAQLDAGAIRDAIDELISATDLTSDEITEAFGRTAPEEIADETGEQTAEAMENAFRSWYDAEGIERPSYTSRELAAGMTLCAAICIKEDANDGMDD